MMQTREEVHEKFSCKQLYILGILQIVIPGILSFSFGIMAVVVQAPISSFCAIGIWSAFVVSATG